MRSDTAFFSAAVISRRFPLRLGLGLALCGGGGRGDVPEAVELR